MSLHISLFSVVESVTNAQTERCPLLENWVLDQSVFLRKQVGTHFGHDMTGLDMLPAYLIERCHIRRYVIREAHLTLAAMKVYDISGDGAQGAGYVLDEGVGLFRRGQHVVVVPKACGQLREGVFAFGGGHHNEARLRVWVFDRVEGASGRFEIVVGQSPRFSHYQDRSSHGLSLAVRRRFIIIIITNSCQTATQRQRRRPWNAVRSHNCCGMNVIEGNTVALGLM